MSTIGDNIRSLRNAFGETQEQLAEKTFFTKSAIGNYETDQRTIDLEKTSRIAQHFMVSEELLISGDFSDLGRLRFDLEHWQRSMDTLFPTASSEAALRCEPFRRAYAAHKDLYDRYSKDPDLDIEPVILACIEDYAKASDDGRASIDAAVNTLALYYLSLFESRVIELLCASEVEPAILEQILSQNDLSRFDFIDFKGELLQEAQEELMQLRCPENRKAILDLKKSIKQSSAYHDLADYYLALPYYFNLDGNELSIGLNATILVEMMRSFSAVGNQYAACFLHLLESSYVK